MKVHITFDVHTACGILAADYLSVGPRLAEYATCERCIAGLRKAAREAGTRPLVAVTS